MILTILSVELFLHLSLDLNLPSVFGSYMRFLLKGVSNDKGPLVSNKVVTIFHVILQFISTNGVFKYLDKILYSDLEQWVKQYYCVVVIMGKGYEVCPFVI